MGRKLTTGVATGLGVACLVLGLSADAYGAELSSSFATSNEGWSKLENPCTATPSVTPADWSSTQGNPAGSITGVDNCMGSSSPSVETEFWSFLAPAARYSMGNATRRMRRL